MVDTEQQIVLEGQWSMGVFYSGTKTYLQDKSVYSGTFVWNRSSLQYELSGRDESLTVLYAMKQKTVLRGHWDRGNFVQGEIQHWNADGQCWLIQRGHFSWWSQDEPFELTGPDGMTRLVLEHVTYTGTWLHGRLVTGTKETKTQCLTGTFSTKAAKTHEWVLSKGKIQNLVSGDAWEGQFTPNQLLDCEQGTYTCAKDKTIKSGKWSKGRFVYGKCSFPNQSSMTGKWKPDGTIEDGPGSRVLCNGSEIKGQWMNGKLHHRNKQRSKAPSAECDNFTYAGDCVDGQREGYGIAVKESKNVKVRYEGFWKQDKRHGLFTVYRQDHVTQGTYVMDVAHGTFYSTTADNKTCRVEFVDGKQRVKVDCELKPIHTMKIKDPKGTLEEQIGSHTKRKRFRQEDTCAVCAISAEEEDMVFFQPCGHHAVCRQCVAKLNQCPLCRQVILEAE